MSVCFSGNLRESVRIRSDKLKEEGGLIKILKQLGVVTIMSFFVGFGAMLGAVTAAKINNIVLISISESSFLDKEIAGE